MSRAKGAQCYARRPQRYREMMNWHALERVARSNNSLPTFAVFLGILLSLSSCALVKDLSKAEKSLASLAGGFSSLSKSARKVVFHIKKTMAIIPESSSGLPSSAPHVNLRPRLNSQQSYTPIHQVPFSTSIFRLGVVRNRVKAFSDGFRRGASNPEPYLSQLRKKHPELSGWFNTPKQERIFLTGSGKSRAKIEAFSTEKRKVGKATFFYKDCKPLCTDEEVGAMYSSSGESGLWYDWDVMESIFLEAELDTIRKLSGLKPGNSFYIGMFSSKDIQQIESYLDAASKVYSASRAEYRDHNGNDPRHSER